MFFSLKEIQGYHLHSQEGDFGEIKSFLIDDFEWVVRYLVVTIGSRDVLLSVRAFGAPDPASRILPVNLSKERMMNSPDVDLSKPLSRQIEGAISDYFEWPYYWESDDVPNTLPGDLTSIPLIDLELDREQQEEEQELIPQTGSGDSQFRENESHLRSTQDIFGGSIHTTNDDQDAGRLDDMISRDEDWNILYLVVDTGGLLSNKKVLVAPTWVQKINRRSSQIDLDLSEETIRNSPDYTGIEDISEDYETRLRGYYNHQ